MIVRMSGRIDEVGESAVVLDRGGVGYQVMVPVYALEELAGTQGQDATLHTLEYLEGSAAGGNMIPRLVGFPRVEDRAFFERFITVKGMGARKALKALKLPVATVAAAIESGDTRLLATLPGIGKRAAEQIIAELKGKVASFVLEGSGGELAEEGLSAESLSAEQRDALEVIVALGERRADAQRWLERAMQLQPDTRGADEWVRIVYRVRSGAE